MGSLAGKNEVAGRPRFGTHLSIAGGLENAIRAAATLKCDCVQIFVKNQRQWRAPPLAKEQVERFLAARRGTTISPVVAHASYLLNLAAPNETTRAASIAAMIDELERCEALDVSALVFHPGAHLEDSMEVGIERIARSLDSVCAATPGFRTRILLETTAGQGTSIGWQFDHIAAIRDRLMSPERVGVCLDTCHLFAAGYDFRTAAGYAAMMDKLDRTIGRSQVCCIHVNDSKKPLGSRVDRHEHIGKGKIGKSGFAQFVNDARWGGVPMILETPKGTDGRGTDLDKVNLKRLRDLIVPD